MSQAGMLNTAGGPSPPDVPTEFITDDGTAVPIANQLEILGGTSTDNNPNGVQTTGSTNVVIVQLTNRAVGSGSTVGAVDTTIITFTPPLTAGTYKLTFEIAAYNATDLASGSGYTVEGTVVANGAGALATVGTPSRIMIGDAAVFDISLIEVTISGGDILLEVTGVLDKTINWAAELNFIFVGA